MNPKKLIINCVETFNAGDAEKIAEFYHDKAINHQVTNVPVIGKKAIREMFEYEFLEC